MKDLRRQSSHIWACDDRPCPHVAAYAHGVMVGVDEDLR